MITEGLAFIAATAAAGAAGSLPRLRAVLTFPPHGWSGQDSGRMRVAGGLVGAALGLAAGALLPGRLGVLAAAAAPAAGFFAPDLRAARLRRRQREAVRRDLPALLDLLRLTIEAGTSLPEALAEVGRRSNALLARQWAAVGAQATVGVPLADALECHRRELPMSEVEAFVGALKRATRHGAPLSDTLAAQARDARLARRRAVHEEAAKAAPKMQLVVALLLVPSVLLLVAAGLLSALTAGGNDALLGF